MTDTGIYRLAHDGLRAYLDNSGAFFGADVPLLEKDAAGRWRPRPRRTLERLFEIGYGEPFDLYSRMAKLASVASALNANDRSMALSALTQMSLPALADATAARRMAGADGLAKDSPDAQGEIRIPPGGGDTSGGATSESDV